jgi:hypothetical protein
VPKPARNESSAGAARNNTSSDPETRTDELDAGDLALLEKWAAQQAEKPVRVESASTTGLVAVAGPPEEEPGLEPFGSGMPPPSTVRFETGLRICPRCKKPVHLSAAYCRECGTPVPRK